MATAIPTRTPPVFRQAGVCLHIASLPGPFGIGEIGAEARRFVDTMCQMQLGVWQFLPTGPTAYGDSPYQPLSTFAGNELLISIGDLLETGLLAEQEAEELTALPTGFVDYGALIPVKTRLLDIAAQRFSYKASDENKARYAAFIAANDTAWLHDYALFRILKTRHGERSWPEWAPEYVRRDQQALHKLEIDEAPQIESIKIIQFLFHEQWRRFRAYANAGGITLFGDMPIYIALDSSDAWADRDLLRLDENGRPEHVAGVPPDYYSEDGQRWGNPLYAWEKHASDGYQWWIDRLRAAAKLSNLVRIDHFRGFEAYWSVPADSATARIGAWEPGPGDAIFDAMQAALGPLPIVAEDLGVITPEVEALRDRHHIPGMRVLQFDVCDPEFRLTDVGQNSVCYTGTHDNDTTQGWFHGGPGDIRSAAEIKRTQKAVLEITCGTPETIHSDLIRAAFSTNAQLAIAPMQDYLGLGSDARLNTPGTPGGNWRWRVLLTQLEPEFCDNIADMVRASGRELTH
ncbi:MAG: 4-alpha-glucanotransferase [Gammaproteobacteria bacterium]|nr:4-alpha-glucanotransferase [Gammaproteobacteria bacterium]NND46882.1 4-alpha-glucanotransferase [Woeseiaceae bacterium]